MLANASPLELAYTAPSAIGCLIAMLLLYFVVGDELNRRAAGINGVVRLDLQKSISTALALVWTLGALTMIGVNAMMTPPNPNIHVDPTTASASFMNALLFISIDAVLIALAIYRLLQRDAVRREVAREVRQQLIVEEAKRLLDRRDRREGDTPAPPEDPPRTDDLVNL